MINEKKERGRPKKLSTQILKDIVKAYAISNKNMPILIKTTALAKYGQEHGYDVKYYNFSRNEEIKKYIDDYNELLRKKHLKVATGSITPIYSTLDVQKFLAINNTRKKLEKALREFDNVNANLVERYGKLESDFIKTKEENITLKSEIIKLNNQIRDYDIIKKSEIKNIKDEKKSVEDINKKLRRKISIYEYFLKDKFLDVISQQALAIEGIVDMELNQNSTDTLIDINEYSNNKTDLSYILEKYTELVNNIQQTETEYKDISEIGIDYAMDINETLSEDYELDDDLDNIDEDEENSEDLFDDLLNLFD